METDVVNENGMQENCLTEEEKLSESESCGSPEQTDGATVSQDDNSPENIPNDSEVRKRNIVPETLVTADLEDELACSVCLLLSVHPTTLVCGHTSCRVCLAKWYFTSKKKECPLCRQAYQGLPRTNVQIRSMIHKLYPEKARQRDLDVDADKDSKHLVAKYDTELSEEKPPKRKTENDVASFCAGIIIAICVFIVTYLAWYWQSSDTNLLVLKPVQTWKPNDVAQWLSELGWAEEYSSCALDNHVDGTVLLMMSTDDLEPVLNITNPVHQRAFFFALEILQEEGTKMPANVWEYKAIYPGRALFLVLAMKMIPRTSILYMWLYFYDDMFIPFLKTTTDLQGSNPEEMQAECVEISLAQWVAFLVYAVLVPEWLVVVAAAQMFSQHFFTPMFVISTAVLYQILEFLSWIALFRSESITRSVLGLIKMYSKCLVNAFMCMVLWPIVPHLICDICFYCALYISPVMASKEVYQKISTF